MPIILKRVSLHCIAAVLLSGAVTALAQGQNNRFPLVTGSAQTDELLAERRAEYQRHSRVSQKIADERTDAFADFRIARNHCTGAKCADADNQYRERLKQIEDEATREQATHTKNLNAIDHKLDAPSTGPNVRIVYRVRNRARVEAAAIDVPDAQWIPADLARPRYLSSRCGPSSISCSLN